MKNNRKDKASHGTKRIKKNQNNAADKLFFSLNFFQENKKKQEKHLNAKKKITTEQKHMSKTHFTETTYEISY